MNDRILIQMNYFGPFLTEDEVTKLRNGKGDDPVWSDVSRQLLESFFDLPIDALPEEVLIRYVAATTKESHSTIVPHSEEIVDRLLNPLKSAKRNFALGDYMATIALCGVVGEMLAILLWKINDISLKGKPITEDQEKGLFGKSFERMGQDQRLKVLKTFGTIDQETYDQFVLLKNSRRPYLHLWSADRSNEEDEALNVLLTTFQLFKGITGIGLADSSSVTVNPLLLKFLNQNVNQEKIENE